MSAQDHGAERRAMKFTALMQSFEEYVNEVVASNHGMKQEDVPKIVIDNFQRSMKANVDFHTELAIKNEDAGQTAKATYHKVMAQTYKSFMR